MKTIARDHIGHRVAGLEEQALSVLIQKRDNDFRFGNGSATSIMYLPHKEDGANRGVNGDYVADFGRQGGLGIRRAQIGQSRHASLQRGRVHGLALAREVLERRSHAYDQFACDDDRCSDGNDAEKDLSRASHGPILVCAFETRCHYNTCPSVPQKRQNIPGLVQSRQASGFWSPPGAAST
jgi:hypothetical protein